MKSPLLVFLCILLSFSFVACHGKKQSSPGPQEQRQKEEKKEENKNKNKDQNNTPDPKKEGFDLKLSDFDKEICSVELRPQRADDRQGYIDAEGPDDRRCDSSFPCTFEEYSFLIKAAEGVKNAKDGHVLRHNSALQTIYSGLEKVDNYLSERYRMRIAGQENLHDRDHHDYARGCYFVTNYKYRDSDILEVDGKSIKKLKYEVSVLIPGLIEE